jgi:Tfp pilus assembly protein PilF
MKLKLVIGILALPVLAICASGASPYALVEKGNMAFKAGRYDEALTQYERASVSAPELAELYFNKGAVLYQKEDFEAAADAFEQAALRSKKPGLEARALYNQGNCAFREAERQRDSDLGKSIKACEEAVGHYKDALRFDGAMKIAAENIEVVRLYLKALLDEQQKKEEEQQQQDDLGKKLKELYERQVAAVKQCVALKQATPKLPEPDVNEDPLAGPREGNPGFDEGTRPSNPDGAFEAEPAADPQVQEKAKWAAFVKEHADVQGTLQQDTTTVLNQMQQLKAQMEQQAAAPPAGQPATPPSADPMVEKLALATVEVGEAVNAQGAAVQVLEGPQLPEATQRETEAAIHLQKALEALSDPQQEKRDGEEQQEKNGDNQQDQEKQDGEKKSDSQDGKNEQGDEKEDGEKKDGEQEQSEGDQEKSDDQEKPQQGALKPLGESADDILNEEKENEKRRVRVIPGGGRAVDKDW